MTNSVVQFLGDNCSSSSSSKRPQYHATADETANGMDKVCRELLTHFDMLVDV
jgi:hypothetical protein